MIEPRRDRLLEESHAAFQRLREALLLGAEHAHDLVAVLAELGIRRRHLVDDGAREPRQERRLHADPQSVLDGAADDAAQDVAPPLVRRRDAVADDERHPAPVVGEHAVRLRRVGRVAVRDAGLPRDPAHDQLVAVGVVDRRDALHHAGHALEPHARVDVLLGKRRQRSVGVELVLHEDEVPDLEEPLAPCAPRQAVGRAAARLLAPVEVDLRVRAAGARPADRPEVLGRGQRHDPLGRHPDLLPEVDRDLVRAELELGVAGVDAHPDPLPVEAEALAEELGRVRDRAVLEVLPEREVAEHLEERQVVGVEPDLVDVGRPEHLLAGGRQRRGRRLTAQEVRHLGLHPRRRQEGRAVVCPRDERRRRAAQVALLLEEREESFAQLGRRPHRD